MRWLRIFGKDSKMHKREAIRLYRSGEEPTVSKLMELDDEVLRLQEKLTTIERDSHTSSKPPSTDGPKAAPPSASLPNTGRSAGGQPGHRGTHRELVPIEQVKEVIPHFPDRCGHCARSLPQTPDPFPTRWQVAKLPPMKVEIIEHQAHAVTCSCGHVTRAALPPDVASSQFDPSLAALIAYLTAVLRVPRRSVRDFCRTFLQTELSTASVQTLVEETSTALAGPVKELALALPNEHALHVDETGWRKKRWLWIFLATRYAYFTVAKSRGAKVLAAVLGETFHGILTVDRYGAYITYHKGQMQICWAHLKRDFLALTELGRATNNEEAITFGTLLEDLRTQLFALWHRFCDGAISRDTLIKETQPTIDTIIQSLEKQRTSENKRVRTLAKGLWKRQDHLFTFIRHEGVEPTNNNAERGLRPAVQWRKICFGNRSDAGALATSRLLTTTQTCRLQARDPFAFLQQAVENHRKGVPVPSLIPL